MQSINKHANTGLVERIRDKIYSWLHLTNDPVVQVYNGYGNKTHAFVFGHVFRFSALPRKRFRKLFVTNTFAVFRSFMVRPWPAAKVRLLWRDRQFDCSTEDDGFFRFEFFPGDDIEEGWHALQVVLLHPESGEIIASGNGQIFIPYQNQYAIISDIDDTFLISHSSRLRKRLYVLLTKNAHSRKPFEGVVKHYQLLAAAGTIHDIPNPFFYVSSSEWNLYPFIAEFSHRNQLPKGVYLLSQLKKLREVFKTGQGKHQAKFMRIVRIIEAYPVRKFILLGDDSQEDPNIYASIVKHFPGKIEAVYLRRIHHPNEENTINQVAYISSQNVPCCYFKHSSEAISHSKEIGLIGSF